MYGALFAEFGVFLIGYRFEPYVFGIFTGYGESKVGKPAVGGCPMPVFHIGGDVDYGAGQNLYSGFPFFLIPAAAGHSHEHLASAMGGFVDMPVVAASRLECHIGKWYLAG